MTISEPAVPAPIDRDVWNAAVEAAAEAMEDSAMRWLGHDLGTIHRDDIADMALAAAVPVLLDALAGRIEAMDPVAAALAGQRAWHDAAEIVRSFAREVSL